MNDPADIIRDTLAEAQRLIGGDTLTPEKIKRIDHAVRQKWAGERPYVAAASTQPRNAQIRTEYQNGQSINQLVRRHRLTPRRIRQIISMSR